MMKNLEAGRVEESVEKMLREPVAGSPRVVGMALVPSVPLLDIVVVATGEATDPVYVMVLCPASEVDGVTLHQRVVLPGVPRAEEDIEVVEFGEGTIVAVHGIVDNYNLMIKIQLSFYTSYFNTSMSYQNLKPQIFASADLYWREHLDEEGYAVIGDVLTERERGEAFRFFLKDMQTVSPKFDVRDPSTYEINFTPMMFSKGLAMFNGFGNSDFMWYLRTRSSIQHIYETLFGTRELNVSMDGFSLFVSSDQKPGQWLHIDQHPEDSLLSIQGAYNFLPVGETSAGLVIVPRSHLTYKPVINRKTDWITYDKNKSGYEHLESEAVKLIIPKNCFVLWNSKLLHANTGITGKKMRRFDRLTCYITYLPKDDRLSTVRQRAYLNGDTTSHWANRCEIKKYPYGFGPTYESRGFGRIQPTLVEGKIPQDRLNFL
ncbi:MAG: phytanoyl-CoA dioxygenase family protein [Nitrososphaerales archaeon]